MNPKANSAATKKPFRMTRKMAMERSRRLVVREFSTPTIPRIPHMDYLVVKVDRKNDDPRKKMRCIACDDPAACNGRARMRGSQWPLKA